MTVRSLNQQVSAELFAIRIIGPRYARSSCVYYSFRARGSGNRFYRELLLSDSLIRPVIVARQDLRAATHRPHRHRSLIETSNDISRANCRTTNIAGQIEKLNTPSFISSTPAHLDAFYRSLAHDCFRFYAPRVLFTSMCFFYLSLSPLFSFYFFLAKPTIFRISRNW